ncbi:heat repeat-containing protein 3-like [Plakobranchus ocellatus]|uniref:Heat repeat-containing protein 3-like n=1 Tax=Plakobranchus ocellatus TaxID=259542 RepID=A0AAV4C6E6_9GAST|nr:heat repeat-containing protein 3-like [Plakobranchus ocellatus]
MGKNRAKRFGYLRPTPTGISADLDIDNELENGTHMNGTTPSAISNIIDKLQAPGTEERACGCKILASIVSQPSAIGHLLNANAIKIAGPLFLDPCLDVRKSALGAIKNMSVFGQEDVCDVMVSQDILTPLVAVINEYGNNWDPPKEATKYDTATDVLVEAVELLANLCHLIHPLDQAFFDSIKPAWAQVSRHHIVNCGKSVSLIALQVFWDKSETPEIATQSFRAVAIVPFDPDRVLNSGKLAPFAVFFTAQALPCQRNQLSPVPLP